MPENHNSEESQSFWGLAFLRYNPLRKEYKINDYKALEEVLKTISKKHSIVQSKEFLNLVNLKKDRFISKNWFFCFFFHKLKSPEGLKIE